MLIKLFDSAQKALFIPEGLGGQAKKTYRKHNLWQTNKRSSLIKQLLIDQFTIFVGFFLCRLSCSLHAFLEAAHSAMPQTSIWQLPTVQKAIASLQNCEKKTRRTNLKGGKLQGARERRDMTRFVVWKNLSMQSQGDETRSLLLRKSLRFLLALLSF